MKSSIIKSEIKEALSYPRLMKSSLTGIVALFVSEFNAIFVYVPERHGHGNPIGKDIHTDGNANVYWKDFTGTIALSN